MTALLCLLLTQAPSMTEQPLFRYSAAHRHHGQVELAFDVPPEARAIQVRFAQRLDGMRVEVRGGDASGRSIPLQPERRVGGDTVDVGWTPAGVREVTVVLHHHLRGEPVVVGWATGGTR